MSDGEKQPAVDTVQVTLTVPRETARELDAWIEKQKANGDRTLKRSRAGAILLARALAREKPQERET